FGGGPKPIALPHVVGEPVPQAEQALTAAGFQTERHPVESTPQNLDRVVAMAPADQAVPGTTVRLDVGAGPAEVEVPNLLGLDRVQAQASLQQVGLTLSPDQGTQVAQDDKDIGRVLVQDPAAGGRLTKGKSVAITVGVAPETVGVPDVVGTNIDQAQRNIVVAHLSSTVQDVDSTLPKGQVVKQNPGGGNTVKAGTTVTLTVSRGNQIKMPDLHGLSPVEAQNALRKLGWTGTLKQTFTPVEDATQVGLVVTQDVPAGTGFARDQNITITVGQNNAATTTTTTSGIFGSTPGFGGG
ncbi:MAG: PASTA domain-containing protein, partial [Actinomycetota bacterium]|nr:PASTA domain-containing protein [Actinomycetota bacterium]